MWISLNNSFLSIVHKDCADDELLVRARRDGDIERLFPDAKVTVEPGHDYRCRARVPRSEVARVMAERIESIAYSNFKDSVRDDALYAVYSSAWSVLGRLQPGGPYSSDGTR